MCHPQIIGKKKSLIEFRCVLNSMFVTGDARLRDEGNLPSTFFNDGEKKLNIYCNTFKYKVPYTRPVGISAVCDTRYGSDKIITSLCNDYSLPFFQILP